MFGKKADAIADIHAMVREQMELSATEKSVSPISPVSVLLAEDFIRALPRGCPLPEFVPEPDGSIAMEWRRSRSHVFVVSIGTSNRLAYAWLDETDRGHGVSKFDGEKIPRRILEGIAAILNTGNASIWAA